MENKGYGLCARRYWGICGAPNTRQWPPAFEFLGRVVLHIEAEGARQTICSFVSQMQQQGTGYTLKLKDARRPEGFSFGLADGASCARMKNRRASCTP